MNAALPSSANIGSFEPMFELGRGGMGTALLARAVGAAGFERLVVIKRLHPHLLDQPDAVRRFLDEARIAAHIRHANVVATHLVGTDEQGHYLVLDYVEGASLEELVDRAALKREKIPPPIVLRIALDALAGLQAAHEARDTAGQRLELLHRDVSPQNVLVGLDGVARVSDFGIAKSAQGSVQTDKQYIVGKLMYLPPEYLQRQAVGPDFDVYSLGVSLWMALAATEPWSQADDATMVTQILTSGVPRLSTAISVAPQLDDLIAKACARERSARFRTAREMMDAIEHIGRQTGWIASHGEVSDLVQRLMGTDLAERRERVAARLANEGEEPIALLRPISVPGNEDVTAELPLKPARVVPAALLALLLLLGFSSVWFWRRYTSPVQDATPSAAPVAAKPSSVPLSAPQRSAPAPAPTPPEPSAAPVATKARARPARAPVPRHVAAPKPTAVPAPPAPTPTPATDGISKKNPYRK